MARSLGSLTLQLQADVKRLEKDLARANSKIRQAAEKMEKRAAVVRGALTRIAAPLSGVAAIAGFRNLIGDLSDLQTTSQRLGQSAESLQAYRLAADQVNVAQSALDQGLQRFTRRVAEAVNGQGELRGTLEQYGISLFDTEGRVRSVDNVLGDFADAIKGAGTEQEKLRLAFKGFDSEGAALVNLLRGGSEGLDEFKRRARESGAVINNDLVAAADELDGKLKALAATIRGQFSSAALQLVQNVRQAFDPKFTFDFGKSLDDNRRRAAELRREIEELQRTGGEGQGFAALVGELGRLEARDPSLVIKNTRSQVEELNRRLGELRSNADAIPDLGNRINAGGQAQKRIAEVTNEISRLQSVIADAEKALKGIDPNAAAPGGFTPPPPVGSKGKSKAQRAAEASAGVITALREELALTAAITEEEKFRVSLTQGRFKQLVEGDKQIGLQLANEIKANEALAAQRQEALEKEREREELAASVIAGLERQVATYNLTTEAARIRFDLEEGAYKSLDAASKQRIDNLARELDGMEAAKKVAEDLAKQQEDAARELTHRAAEFGNTFASAFEGAVVEGKKFSDVLKGLEQDLIRIIARQAITVPLQNAIGGLFDGGSGLLSKIFGGGKAAGGPVSAGKTYLVGERGPELFTPPTSGKIVPNNKLAGGDTVVNVQVNGVTDVDSFRRSVPQIQAQMISAADLARVRNK